MKEKNNIQGFTLIELLIVMVILGLLAAFSLPSFRQTLLNYRLKSLTYDVLSGLQKARITAIKENNTIKFILDADGFSYEVNGVEQKTLFSAYGTATYGYGAATKTWSGKALPTSVPTSVSYSFSSRGTSSSKTIYFDNGSANKDDKQLSYAVTVVNTGFTQARKYVPCDGTEDNNYCWIK